MCSFMPWATEHYWLAFWLALAILAVIANAIYNFSVVLIKWRSSK